MIARFSMSAAVGRRLREIGIPRRVPLERLAAQTGLRPAVLLAIEEGDERPTLTTLDRLARQLSVSVVELVESARGPARAPDPNVEAMGLERIAHAVTALPTRLGDKLEAVELEVVKHAMSVCGGNRSAAARLLGIERKALIRRWDKTRRRAARRGG
jgi:transcriptional regulator with XRE-family HTH domain